MNKLTLFFVTAALMLVSVSANAVRTVESSITQVIFSGNGGGFINLSSELDVNGNVCSPIKRYQIYEDKVGKDGLLAAALGAHLSNRTVQLDIEDCVIFTGASPSISNVIVK